MTEPIQNLILSLFSALAITFVTIPLLIKLAESKNLYDEPDSARKSHTKRTPTLGGIAIFAGLIFSISFWAKFSNFVEIQYIIASLTIIGIIGIIDDIIGLAPFKKLMGQIFASFILVIWGDIRIDSLFGIFGIGELHYIVSVLFTVFTLLIIINSFNLIDGLNGLSASIGIISSIILGTWFYMNNENSQFSIIAFALTGALIGFLRYNVTPAKIFMGDTGSLLLGLILGMLSIKFIDINFHKTGAVLVKSVPIVAISIIIIPLFDLLRSFSIRIINKRSPFRPDRNHMHHMLIDLGFSHTFATGILVIFNISIITIAFCFDNIGIYPLGFIILSISILFSSVLYILLNKKQKKLNNNKIISNEK
jgi:UDP-N-acetylmuramyl pentapeptide phosphotransferase/UDP-N-acetylglucosamine-1-phosphate transferase